MIIKRLSAIVCALTCLFALSRMCAAQDSPLNGSWKSDPSSLKYDGPTFSIAVDADGITTTRGGEAMPKVVCDGTPHSSSNGEMATCTKSADGYTVSSTKDGKHVETATATLSGGGNRLTSKFEMIPSTGDPSTVTIYSKRVSGGPGLAGEWKEVKITETSDTGVLKIAVHGDMVDFKETDVATPVTCKLDGSDTKSGTGFMSVKLAGARTLKVTYKDKDGKVRRVNTFALSADGTIITETDVTPAPAPSTMTLVLHKM